MGFTVRLEERITLSQVAEAVRLRFPVDLDEHSWRRVAESRSLLDRFVADDRIIYGVTTSMGGFAHHLVPSTDAQQLQENLINAVATNVGAYLDEDTTRAIMIARVVSLSLGNSAISSENLEIYLGMLNAGVIPCIPEKGSLGTSGDLGPLAYIALVSIGQWKARYGGEILHGGEALRRAGLTPARLSYKEGLAMINGTAGMVGIALLTYHTARRMVELYHVISALSIEGLAGIVDPFHPQVHTVKLHRGQADVAARIYNGLRDSTMARDERSIEAALVARRDGSSVITTSGLAEEKMAIEDAYSIRCTPQILGPVVDSLDWIATTIENELNSTSDNPIIVPDVGEAFHNGHFHGQYIAMAMDHLGIALTTVTNLANRRVDRFLDQSNSNGLPPFLCQDNPGLRLGLMGGQFMTASVTAETRALTVPLSIQSLSTTADFQDIVSFGFVAARRAREILRNTAYVVAFELLCACQAADIRGIDGLSSWTRPLYERVRRIVPYLDHDITITEYIESLASFLLSSEADDFTAVPNTDKSP
ncbi:phenylalanine aminomutase (D-beta-phenylalanine forming) [Nocardia gipuzkoensis]|uniref:phenylalanine aminomutase (D-beta-phenylalanine forming) n=1 Tax=Nocardia gipuzkoensis TaxID=2749991 RepID=UPI00237EDF7E|nr:phenylalanine aminomutase (D-beta-phenylalanine forming) [Nocardia gipuzkoensis]MDE1675500.1 phenylalanine aminomutase (D-beta-phenylalanine forming) [Nocardia gipuzkoensis]